MTSGYVIRPRALRDLEDIWDYTAETWSIPQAEIYLRQIQSCLEQLASDPYLGRPCDQIRAGYRRHPTGSHIVFYLISNGNIDVIRILHQRMDVSRSL